jgi:hypothetical protein
MSIKVYTPVADSVDGRGSITFVFEREDVKDFEIGTIFLAKGEMWEVIGHDRPWYNISKKLRKRENELKAFYVRKVKV